MLRWRCIALLLVLSWGVLAPPIVMAQPPSTTLGPSGFYVTPSFTVAELYDDNIFSRATGRETDFITRFTPALQAGYQSAPLTLLGRYTFDAEVYPKHPELTDAQVRQHASIDFQYLPTHPLMLSFKGDYFRTQTPRELNLLTGIEVGRTPAHRFSFNPSIKYQFDPLMSATGGYTFERDKLARGVSTDKHITNLDLERQLTPMDSGDIMYGFRDFRFSSVGVSGGETTITTHVFTVGWKRDITPLTKVTLRGGPRFTEGSIEPEVSASIIHKFQNGEISFTYARTQNTAIGVVGTLDTESFSASVSYELLRFIKVSAEPTFFRNTRAGTEAKIYGLHLGATYQIAEWLSLVGSYHFSFQQKILDSGPGTPGRPDQDIFHNIVTLSFVATYPYRVY